MRGEGGGKEEQEQEKEEGNADKEDGEHERRAQEEEVDEKEGQEKEEDRYVHKRQRKDIPSDTHILKKKNEDEKRENKKSGREERKKRKLCQQLDGDDETDTSKHEVRAKEEEGERMDEEMEDAKQGEGNEGVSCEGDIECEKQGKKEEEHHVEEREMAFFDRIDEQVKASMSTDTRRDLLMVRLPLFK